MSNTLFNGLTFVNVPTWGESGSPQFSRDDYGVDVLTRTYAVRPDQIANFLTAFPKNGTDSTFSGMYIMNVEMTDLNGGESGVAHASVIYRGVAGASGTPIAPFISIHSITQAGGSLGNQALVETSAAHGYSDGDNVVIRGLTSGSPYMNGPWAGIDVTTTKKFLLPAPIIFDTTVDEGEVALSGAIADLNIYKDSVMSGITQQNVTLNYSIDGAGATSRQKDVTYDAPWTEWKYVVEQKPFGPRHSGEMEQ